ncbi:class I SAM-dependent methyltransferase [Dactylosporangium sp. CS-033363]|uniref:class I SAM-dependent methyltransferase n=1 Tax=Dactylosporangium sp. CS-033363 TaxID=3239935 RepID=UPI003D8B58F0
MTTPLKDKHRAIWASGDYAAVAADIIPSLGPVLVEACGIGPGQRVLDVAAGTGNAAIPAALTGADVTASDLTPRLLDIGRRLADERDAKLTWAEADAEALPFGDGEYDCVISCVGVMFAPFHQAAAGELVRVCRPGGTIGLINWTPTGFIGQLFATLKPFAAPPPPGAQPAPLWGDESHVRALLGDHVTSVSAQTRTVRVERFAAADGFREYFKHNYGPTLAVYRLHADDPQRTAELDAALDELAGRFRAADGSMEWEYLLLTARRSEV